MILAPGVPGVAFGAAEDGDARADAEARRSVSAELGISEDWAIVAQVHGSTVAVAESPGFKGEADGLFTTRQRLPLTVATADCVPIALLGDDAVAVVHAGWRGIAAGVVSSAVDRFAAVGDQPNLAVIGPHIGACCYEVGEEVVEAIGGYRGTTTWGTTSANLADAVRDQLGQVEVVAIEDCTMDDDRFASYRENGTERRQVAVVWKP